MLAHYRDHVIKGPLSFWLRVCLNIVNNQDTVSTRATIKQHASPLWRFGFLEGVSYHGYFQLTNSHSFNIYIYAWGVMILYIVFNCIGLCVSLGKKLHAICIQQT